MKITIFYACSALDVDDLVREGSCVLVIGLSRRRYKRGRHCNVPAMRSVAAPHHGRILARGNLRVE